MGKVTDYSSYGSNYSESKLWDKMKQVARKAGIKVVSGHDAGRWLYRRHGRVAVGVARSVVQRHAGNRKESQSPPPRMVRRGARRRVEAVLSISV